MSNNNFSDNSEYLSREQKEALIKQKGRVIWLTGLSGSGKTTIASYLEKSLHNKNIITKVFDGDIIRKGLNKDLSFSNEGRMENIRRIAEVSKQFVECGIIVICAFISPTKEMRKIAADIIGKDDFVEVFVNCPINVCEERDPKGLYKKARKGEIPNFTGIDAPYECPENSDITLNTNETTIEEAGKILLNYVLPKIKSA
ncbi:MAG: adenylyl-sulfate kinase [Bacteroidetes bacterium]|nr:adenylyl-sulfate kinase [Bacteroidota bacterium]